MAFTRIRSFLDSIRKIRIRNKKSQIAVVITLVIAIIMLLILVLINIYRVSFLKMMTSQVADKLALQLASQFGSMSAELHKEERCKINIGKILFLVGAAIAIVAAPFLLAGLPAVFAVLAVAGLGVSVAGIIVSISISGALNRTIVRSFMDLGTLNGLRESALYAALVSLQTDDAICRNNGGGIFYYDANDNKSLDGGENIYDLSMVSEYEDAKSVGRFYAWYFTRRNPLFGGPIIRKKINDFMAKLDEYIDFWNWDNDLWRYNNAALVVEPSDAAPASAPDIDKIGRYLQVTCMGSSGVNACPGWVRDIAANRLTILGIDETIVDDDGNYIDPSGFLSEKFLDWSLNAELFSLDPFFCSTSWAGFGGTSCGPIETVIEDLLLFVGFIKTLKDMPVTLRVQTASSWVKEFYDVEYAHTDEGGDHDLFDRLTRDAYMIGEWILGPDIDTRRLIKEYNKDGDDVSMDGAIRDYTREHHDTCCQQGRTSDSWNVCAQCYTAIDWNVCNCEWVDYDGDGFAETEECDGEVCKDMDDGRWRGLWGTCVAPNKSYAYAGRSHRYHPVCRISSTIGSDPDAWWDYKRGDLYNARPDWCGDLRSEPCANHPLNDGDGCIPCTRPDYAINVNWHRFYWFQGQYSWKHPSYNSVSGFTEARQAAEVLGALKHDLDELKWEIEQFAKGISPYLEVDDKLKEQTVYAWKGKDGRRHLVRAKIDNYPTEVPRLVPDEQLIETCIRLKNGTGNFTMNIWRFDEGRTVQPWWNFTYTKTANDDAYEGDLDYIISAVQDTATPLPEYKDNTLTLFSSPQLSEVCEVAVNSWTEAAYGPHKEDIKIIKTEGDE